MHLGEQDDLELIASYQNSGDQKLVQELYIRYEVRIFRMCMHYLRNAADAEDACVDIYIELTQKLQNQTISNFKSWLYVVSKNHALKRLKAKSRLLLAEENYGEHKVKFEDVLTHKDELFEKLPAAIDQLSESQRWCIVLFYLHGKSYKEIEKIKGYDFKKVKSSIIHGKKNLLKILTNQSK